LWLAARPPMTKPLADNPFAMIPPR